MSSTPTDNGCSISGWTTLQFFDSYREMRMISADIAACVHLTSDRVSTITENNEDIQKQLTNMKEAQKLSSIQLASIQTQLSSLQHEMTTFIKHFKDPGPVSPDGGIAVTKTGDARIGIKSLYTQWG
jgi:hypothetical protein